MASPTPDPLDARAFATLLARSSLHAEAPAEPVAEVDEREVAALVAGIEPTSPTPAATVAVHRAAELLRRQSIQLAEWITQLRDLRLRGGRVFTASDETPAEALDTASTEAQPDDLLLFLATNTRSAESIHLLRTARERGLTRWAVAPHPARGIGPLVDDLIELDCTPDVIADAHHAVLRVISALLDRPAVPLDGTAKPRLVPVADGPDQDDPDQDDRPVTSIDLLIFPAARPARSAAEPGDATADPDPAGSDDGGLPAAERATTPGIADETESGLPKRVPGVNLLPITPLRDERPLRVVRDAASIAAHTTGYFQGWQRGHEIGGYAVGGRPGRETAGGWDFTRDDSRSSTTGHGASHDLGDTEEDEVG